MKLLYIPPLGGGIRDLREAGQHRRLLEDYFSNYAREFDEVLLLSFFDESLSDYPEVRLAPRVRLLPNRWRLHRYLYSLLAPWLHRRELRGVSVIRVSQATGSLPALFMKSFLGAPVAMTYGYDYVLFATVRGKTATLLARLHERIASLAADAWITTTQELVSLLQHRHRAERENIFLIPNGVSLKTFPRAEFDGESDLRSLIFVGRLEEQKNLFHLLDCVSATADRLQTRLKLTLVGAGALKEKLRQHRVSPLLKVELLGAVEQSKLAALFQECQLFVIASHFEGHPKAVLEAMGTGLPVLGKDSPGIGPLLRACGQTTFVDIDSFVEGFRKLSRQEGRQLASARAAESVRKHFDLEQNLLLESELLARLARGGSSSAPRQRLRGSVDQ